MADIIKVVLFGPESTGKTTLAKTLAQHYQTSWNPEFVRVFLELKQKYKQSEEVDESDLYAIGMGQLASETILEYQANQVAIYDTNLLEHYIYVREIFGEAYVESWLKKAIKTLRYDLYLLTSTDIPFVKDAQRDSPASRLHFYAIMKEALVAKKLPFEVVSGNEEVRKQQAITLIDRLIGKRKN